MDKHFAQAIIFLNGFTSCDLWAVKYAQTMASWCVSECCMATTIRICPNLSTCAINVTTSLRSTMCSRAWASLHRNPLRPRNTEGFAKSTTDTASAQSQPICVETSLGTRLLRTNCYTAQAISSEASRWLNIVKDNLGSNCISRAKS